MFAIHERPARLCDGWSRREILRVGGASAFGLTLPDLLAAAAKPSDRPAEDRMFGRAKNLIYLWLQGGPPQHETFDPKPHAPVEIRGVHKPISTNVPGIQFCELLPRIARRADRLAVVRSMSTDDNIHSSSGYWVLTGYKYRGSNARTIQATDWPYFGSLVKMLKPSETLPPLSTVWVPDIMRLNESVTPAGQTAGFLGGKWHPDRFVGDPAAANYKVQGLAADGISPLRFDRRMSLLKQVDRQFAAIHRGDVLRNFDSFQRQAFDLMTSGKARDAFAIEKEPDKVRDAYGRYTWGQCCLLARRLIEAGVRMVHVNWPREPGDNAVDNPLWDTHAQNADRLEDVLCPKFDVTFTALLDDLHARGLLDETLVIAVGEFGRTPKINGKGGRDHWGPVFSFAMAGAGISGGQVYGESDKNGAYPAKDRVRGGDLTATIFHLLGINPLAMFQDPAGRPHRLTEGAPLFKLLGSEPATKRRQPSAGSIARVPAFDPSLLLNTKFADVTNIRGFDGPSRPKGWRAEPLAAGLFVEFRRTGFQPVRKPVSNAKRKGSTRGTDGLETRPTENAEAAHVARIGVQAAANSPLKLKRGQQAVLAQEVRSPFAGRYKLSLRFRGSATSQEAFASSFGKQLGCRLSFFQFNNQKKTPRERHELASAPFQPKLGDWRTVELEKNFVNPTPGANFSFGSGLGVAVIVESRGDWSFATTGEDATAMLEIAEVDLRFIGKERIETVKV
jgi:Protein of unknown function (DUF1501)